MISLVLLAALAVPQQEIPRKTMPEDADLVVLDGDPMVDVRNLAKVAYTI